MDNTRRPLQHKLTGALPLQTPSTLKWMFPRMNTRSHLEVVADVSQIDVATWQQVQMIHITGLEMSVIPI